MLYFLFVKILFVFEDIALHAPCVAFHWDRETWQGSKTFLADRLPERHNDCSATNDAADRVQVTVARILDSCVL